MKQIKHVLVLLLLVLPMFALAPTLVASPNNTPMSYEKVDTSLPAQFVKETLRVAVYAESNLTLPAYATGGVYSDNYNDVISMLVGEGFSVTAMSTQMILDHKLLAADYDVLVLPNQLPKDEIVNLVKDYWLAGGGVLSLEGSIGYCFYAGLIDPAYEGGFERVPVASPGMWGQTNTSEVSSFEVVARHPVTKAFDVDEVLSPPTGNFTILNGPELVSTIGDRFVPLIDASVGPIPAVAVFENPDRAGKVVQVPGDCSSFSVWQKQIIADAIDWLAPRPKGRILIDLNHDNWIAPDPWDPYHEYYPLETFRNGLVSYSYTVDKLFDNLTLARLELCDMLVIPMPNGNFTAAEVEAVRTWVMNGGGLFVLGDVPSLENVALNSNYLVSPYDISFNITAGESGFGAAAVPPANLHPLHENALDMEYGNSAYLNITGDAYPLWFYNDNIVAAGQEYGEGRVIVSGDGNIAADGLDILTQDNYQFLLNVANWLTAAKAKILVYVDHGYDPRDPNQVPINGPVAQALNELGLSFYITSEGYYFNKSLFYSSWDLVVFDNINSGTIPYQPHLMEFVEGGGKLIMNTWNMNSQINAYFGIDSYNELQSSPWTLYVWNENHPVFTKPVDYGVDNVSSTLDVFGGTGVYALNFTTFANASTIAGFSSTVGQGAGILLCAGGRAIMNGPLLSLYGEDTDDSTYMDAYELWLNEIGFLYYDRPTINHPDDVTYMETETGNEITWTPVADAGPWDYIVRRNGSIIDSGHWGGGSITVDVDGVNASITEYQLTVFDRLGYSASDMVNLNVTEYVAPTTTGGGIPIDPTILVIVAAVGVVIIIIIIIVMKKKK